MNGEWEVKVSGNTTHYRKKLYDAYGNHVGTIGICKPAKQTGKKKMPGKPLLLGQQTAECHYPWGELICR